MPSPENSISQTPLISGSLSTKNRKKGGIGRDASNKMNMNEEKGSKGKLRGDISLHNKVSAIPF